MHLKNLHLALKSKNYWILCFDLCYVASAKTDAYVEYGVYLWDYAAGALIAKDAASLLFHSNEETPPKVGIMCSDSGFLPLLKRFGDQVLQAYKNTEGWITYVIGSSQ